MNHYDVLGVAKDADEETIRNAYRRKARHHHADKNNGKDDGMMAQINVAYEVLSDPKRRANYDATGSDNIASLEHAARGIVIAKIGEWMSQEQLEGMDAMEYVRQTLQRDIAVIEQNRMNGQRMKARLQRVRKRFKFRGTGDDILGNLIDGQITNVEQQLEKIEINLQQIKAAIELSKDYECEPATAQQNVPRTGLIAPMFIRG